MDSSVQANLSFLGTDILTVNFTSVRAYKNEVPIDFSINAKVFYPKKANDQFKIIMEVGLKAEGFFELVVAAVGHFKLDKSLTSELQNSFVNVNAPAIMFPYVRSFITTVTSNVGQNIVPIIIPAQFFSGNLEEMTSYPESE